MIATPTAMRVDTVNIKITYFIKLSKSLYLPMINIEILRIIINNDQVIISTPPKTLTAKAAVTIVTAA